MTLIHLYPQADSFEDPTWQFSILLKDFITCKLICVNKTSHNLSGNNHS